MRLILLLLTAICIPFVSANQNCQSHLQNGEYGKYLRCIISERESDIKDKISALKERHQNQLDQIEFRYERLMEQEKRSYDDFEYDIERRINLLERRIADLKYQKADSEDYVREEESKKALKNLLKAYKKVSDLKQDILENKKKQEELNLDFLETQYEFDLRKSLLNF